VTASRGVAPTADASVASTLTTRPVLRRLATCAVAGLLSGCGGAPNADSTITREVEAQLAIVRDATIPAGVTLVGSSGPEREAHSVSAEWSFEAPADWERYLDAAHASLRRSGFERLSTAASTLAYARHVPGDAYRVQISRDASSDRTRVTVTFLAAPD
jgi:hypothetical protein